MLQYRVARETTLRNKGQVKPAQALIIPKFLSDCRLLFGENLGKQPTRLPAVLAMQHLAMSVPHRDKSPPLPLYCRHFPPQRESQRSNLSET